MLFSDVSILNEDFSVSRAQYLKTEGSIISYVGDKPPADASNAISAGNMLIMPAFYNAHTHSPMTLLRGYGGDMPLSDWLTKKVFPFEDRLTGEDCYYATLLAMAESFSHGIVSSSDQYFFCDDILRAVSDSCAKMNISRGLSHFGDSLDKTAYKPLLESKKLFYENHDTLDGRIRVDIALHAEYTATPFLIEAVSELAHEAEAPVQVHISETESEHEECMARHDGMTPTELFEKAGLWDFGGVAAHCVHVKDSDMDILKERGVSVVSCPVSNMKLASGIAPVSRMLEKGLNVALGTDGVSSNNSLNFFEEIKLFSLAAKVREKDPTLVPASAALYAATAAGALAQGRKDCGVIKTGARADFIVLDLDSPSLNPAYELADGLVYSASSRDILMTVCDGRLVYKKGADGRDEYPTVDMEKTLAEVGRSRARILGELGESL